MKIGVISDSPFLTTGFGVEAHEVASALAEAGHEVACFGLKGSPTDRVPHRAFHVWPVNTAAPWDQTLKDFFAQEQPTQIIILIDLFNLREILEYCHAAAWDGTTIVYLTPDGLPAYDDFIDALRHVDECVVTTETCERYLKGCDIPVRVIAPPGVNQDIFKPLPNRDQLREEAGLADCFVVGVFGTNCERKQQPRVLRALASLADSETVAYFHCKMRGYWHLDELAQQLNVADRVLFAGLDSESHGMAHLGNHSAVTNSSQGTSGKTMPAGYGYVERINCCDLIVNCAHSGDVEHIISESQACGVPLAHTDDGGIMTEAMGNGGLLIQPLDVSWGRIGERIFLADPRSIAEAMNSVKQDPALRQQLRQRGFDNAKRYPWSRLRNAMVHLVESPRLL